MKIIEKLTEEVAELEYPNTDLQYAFMNGAECAHKKMELFQLIENAEKNDEDLFKK